LSSKSYDLIHVLALASISLSTKFEVSNSIHHVDMTGDTIQNVENGLVRGS